MILYKWNQVQVHLKQLNNLHHQYQQKSFDLEVELTSFLKNCNDYYESLGHIKKATSMNDMLSLLSTAQSGIHTQTGEKLIIGKRVNILFAIFQILQRCTAFFDTEEAELNNKLLESRQILNSIIMTLWQNKVLNQQVLNSLDTESKIKKFWDDFIQQNDSLQTVSIQLKQLITPYDMYILIGEQLQLLK